ncbi:hypothetical protein [Streptomyces sp. NPDC000878]
MAVAIWTAATGYGTLAGTGRRGSSVMWVVLGLVACGVLWGLVRWYGLYRCHPDKLRYLLPFGDEGREARGTLDKERKKSKRIRDKADLAFGAARTAAEGRVSPFAQRLQALREEQNTLHAEAQQPGEAVGDLLGPTSGPEEWLQLHEHVLASLKRVQSETGETEDVWGESLSLAGLDIETSTDPKHHIGLRVTLPGGQNRLRDWFYPDTADWEIHLNAFVRLVREQIAQEYEFRAQLQAREAENADAIRQAEADHRSAKEKCDREIGEAERDRLKEHADADVVRDKAYDVWMDKGGGLRPWW